MPINTNLIQKTRHFSSRYQRFSRQFGSKYGSIQGKLVSKFHRERNDIKLFHGKFNNIFKLSWRSKLGNLVFLNLRDILSYSKKIENHYKERTNWTRRRFVGQAIQIIVKDGQIIQKVFVTPKGNVIKIKRSELGLLARLLSNT